MVNDDMIVIQEWDDSVSTLKDRFTKRHIVVAVVWALIAMNIAALFIV